MEPFKKANVRLWDRRFVLVESNMYSRKTSATKTLTLDLNLRLL